MRIDAMEFEVGPGAPVGTFLIVWPDKCRRENRDVLLIVRFRGCENKAARMASISRMSPLFVLPLFVLKRTLRRSLPAGGSTSTVRTCAWGPRTSVSTVSAAS